MTTTQIVPRNSQFQTVRQLLERSKDQIAVALPKHMNPDRMLRIVLTSLQRTPKLLDCEPKSLLGSVMQAAQLGLEPDGVLGQAYLVPYKTTVQLLVGYRGLIDLARRSGHVESLQARAVFERDEFDFAYGDEPFLKHRPSREEDPGPLIAVYAVAKLKGGEKPFEVMWRRQIDAIRKRSMAANAGPWVTDYEEMARKTAVRRLCKYLPLSVELADAVALDERAEAGLPQQLEVLDAETDAGEQAPHPTGLDALASEIQNEQRDRRSQLCSEITQAIEILGQKRFTTVMKELDARVSDLGEYDEARLDAIVSALSAAATA